MRAIYAVIEQALTKCRKGQSLIEYTLMISFIALALILIIGIIGEHAIRFFTSFFDLITSIASIRV